MASKYRSSKLAKARKKVRITRTVIFVIFILSLILGLAFWSKDESMRIENVDITDLTYANKKKVEDVVFDALGGKYLNLFSKRNSLIFPRGYVEERIYSEFPSIASVDIDFVGFNHIEVNLTEYEAVAKWCGDNECYLLNNNGYIFIQEPLLSTEDYITFRGEVAGEILRSQLLPPNEFKAFMKFNEVLRDDLDIKIISVNQSDYPVYEFVSKAGVVFMIDREDDMADVIQNIKTVFEKEGINKEQYENLEYVDLRFGNKVFYKLK